MHAEALSHMLCHPLSVKKPGGGIQVTVHPLYPGSRILPTRPSGPPSRPSTPNTSSSVFFFKGQAGFSLPSLAKAIPSSSPPWQFHTADPLLSDPSFLFLPSKRHSVHKPPVSDAHHHDGVKIQHAGAGCPLSASCQKSLMNRRFQSEAQNGRVREAWRASLMIQRQNFPLKNPQTSK
jgi:hypothetical protein